MTEVDRASKRSALLQQLRAKSRQRQGAPGPVAPASPSPAKSFDFSELPGHRQLRMQRSAADMLGIDVPYFRSQEGYAGPTCVVGGREVLNFSTYNYLGLNDHPHVRKSAKAAIDRYGVSVGASRVVAGERDLHAKLEQAIAAAYGVDSAVVMVSGHATNVTTIGALMGPRDLVLTDALIHNSVVEGARLSGADRLTFPHNDFGWIDDLLTRKRGEYERVLIVVEGLYSMDGDAPDLARFVEVKSRHDAWLMVDEAHAFGVLGETGRGIHEAQGVDPGAVEIWMGTLSKTLASCGGYIAGSHALTELLKATAPGFVFSVGLAAPLTAAALAALEVMLDEPERPARLRRNGGRMLAAARDLGLDVGLSQGLSVIPVIIGDSARAAMLSDRTLQGGLNALPITSPAVPEKSARLRFFVTSEHSEAQVDEAVRITGRALEEIGQGALLGG